MMADNTEDMRGANMPAYPTPLIRQACAPSPLIRQACAQFMGHITSTDAYRNCTPYTRDYINDLTLQIYDALKGE